MGERSDRPDPGRRARDNGREKIAYGCAVSRQGLYTAYYVWSWLERRKGREPGDIIDQADRFHIPRLAGDGPDDPGEAGDVIRTLLDDDRGWEDLDREAPLTAVFCLAVAHGVTGHPRVTAL